MAEEKKFQMFRRMDGSQVACRVTEVLYVGKSDTGSVLHFGSGTQVNVHESFDEVIALLN